MRPPEIPRYGTGAAIFAELLGLEELDTNLYRAPVPVLDPMRPRLFGGQVAAQALYAAAMTVADDRRPHSLHGYFLRPGQIDHPVILQVARDRDGRSYSSRHVVALQRGEAIFTLSASFHIEEPGVEFQQPRDPAIPLPEELPEAVLGQVGPEQALVFEVRVDTSRANPVPDGDRFSGMARFWARARTRIGQNPLDHACALAYLSDMGTGFADRPVPGMQAGGATLDHGLYFHREMNLDDWVLVDLRPLAATGARGLYIGFVHDIAGTLLATLTQEMVLRSTR